MRRHDFYAFPRPSPDGRRLAWISWDHPNQPWCGTDLWVANLLGTDMDIHLGPARHIAGGHEESVTQPEWGPDGTLHFVSDRCGWWNLIACRYRQHGLDHLGILEPASGDLEPLPLAFTSIKPYLRATSDRLRSSPPAPPPPPQWSRCA